MRLVAPFCLAATLALTGSNAMQARAATPSADTPAYTQFDGSVAAAKKAMMTDPKLALARADETARIAGQLPPTQQGHVALATARWLQGEAHIFLNEPDQATPLISQALQIVEHNAPGTKLHGDLMRSRGSIAAMSGHIQEALRDFQRAHNIFARSHEERSRAIALQDIGQLYWDAADYGSALRYYGQSAEVFDKDPILLLTSHNSRAEVLRKLHRPAEAEVESRASLKQADALASPLLQIRVLTNLAVAEVEARHLSAAATTVDRAMALSSQGEAAGWKPLVLGTAALLAHARGDDARAAALLDQACVGMDLRTTQMPYKEFHQLAADVYERRGDEVRALAHLKAYQRLDGEARNLTASTSAQLMSARFDFANQNLRIYQLKQGQLQRDIQLERQHARLRTVVLSGSLGAGALVLVLLVVGILSLRRSRNQTRAANVELTRALAAKTEFLATTSHEIRTPLNGILGMTQVLLTDKRIQGDIRGRIEIVQGAGETMRALVDDILDVAKMETGQLVVAHEPTALAKVLRDAAGLWSAHAGAKGLTLTLEADGIPEQIMSDETRLRQIVFNLMSNAVKFTESGSITLAARTCPSDGIDLLELSVTDTGIGIGHGEQARVFEAFHQVDGSTVRQFSGTGLGLAICRRLAEAMGGAITVTSEVGHGTRFTVRLPLHAVEASAPTEVRDESRARPERLAATRLLFMDTNPLSRGIIGALLESKVATVVTTPDGADALLAIERGTVDHLLIDAASAGDVPVAALRAIVDRAHEHGIHVSVLLKPSEDLPMSAIVAVGATQMILKPVAGKALIAALADVYKSAASADAAVDTYDMTTPPITTATRHA